ncbi:MAG: UDP-glucuronic acid decarboxylase family protein [bacterium]
MTRALVTGGAGFVGSHLVDRLLKEGWQVVVLDNLITGSTDNIASHMGDPNFSFIKYDVTEYLFVDGPIDFVFHLASPASPIDFVRYPIQTLKVGALGTHKALGLAKAKKATFLITSTSEVYGDPAIHPQQEDYWGNVNPVGVRGVYDEAKRFAEAMTMAYHRYHELDTRIARLFNTYGPRMRMDDGRVVPNFIAQALRNEPLTVYSPGDQTRSFGYVSDVVEALWRLANSNYNDPVNIGNPDEYTMLEFANIIKELAGSKSEIVFKEPVTPDDPQRRRPDITRARTVLGWEPKVKLEDGLKQTIEYARTRLNLSSK